MFASVFLSGYIFRGLVIFNEYWSQCALQTKMERQKTPRNFQTPATIARILFRQAIDISFWQNVKKFPFFTCSSSSDYGMVEDRNPWSISLLTSPWINLRPCKGWLVSLVQVNLSIALHRHHFGGVKLSFFQLLKLMQIRICPSRFVFVSHISTRGTILTHALLETPCSHMRVNPAFIARYFYRENAILAVWYDGILEQRRRKLEHLLQNNKMWVRTPRAPITRACTPAPKLIIRLLLLL